MIREASQLPPFISLSLFLSFSLSFSLSLSLYLSIYLSIYLSLNPQLSNLQIKQGHNLYQWFNPNIWTY